MKVHFCDCGCGRETQSGSMYIHGHNRRKFVNMFLPENQGPFYCRCGCGEEVPIKGACKRAHNWRIPEVKAARAEKIKALWDDPEFYTRRMVQLVEQNSNEERNKKIGKGSKNNWTREKYRAAHIQALHSSWKDPESKARRIKSLKLAARKRWDDPSYREKMSQTMGYKHLKKGYVNTIKAGRVYYRAGWELIFIQILDSSHIVKRFVTEPFGIKYKFEGERHKYYPDYLVELVDGRIVIVELKGLLQDKIAVRRWEAKQEACQDYCDRHGYEFVVIKQKPIAPLSNYIQ